MPLRISEPLPRPRSSSKASSSPPEPAATSGATTDGELLAHAKRPEWGVAIQVRERGPRTDYQFQDGRLRSIANAFAHLMEPVDRPADETLALQQELAAQSGVILARRERREQARSRGDRIVELTDQIRYFLEQHPDGFDDSAWRQNVRGQEAKRRLKAHREAAIAEAQELLGRDELEQLLAEERYDEVLARALRVLQGTSLVSPADLRPLRELPTAAAASFATALYQALYGDDAQEKRFAALADALSPSGHLVGWTLVTALPALVHPTEQICVRPNTFREQAKWMAPELKWSAEPNAPQYQRLLRMAAALQKRLVRRGLSPRDLLDVYDFIWCTLRPAARKAIAQSVPAPRRSETRAVAAGAKRAARSAA